MFKLERNQAAGGEEATESRRRRSLALAGALLAIGLLASVAAGLWWRASVREERRRTFEAAAADVTATLRTMLRRDADFVATLRSVATMEPGMGPTRFDDWFLTLQGPARQTGTLGTGVLRSLPRGDAVGFQRRRNADPAFSSFVGGHTRIDAPDRGARMCLPAAGDTVGGPLAPALADDLQEDWCDPSSPLGAIQARALRAQAETGQLRVSAVTALGLHTTLFQVAFYRRGIPLASPAQRLGALAGWVSSSFDLQAAVAEARGEHHALDLSLYHRNPDGAAELIDRLGSRAGDGALTRRATFNIRGPWSLTVTQPPGATPEFSPDVQGLIAFALGAIVSLLLAAIILLLSRSREGALALVREKTDELRHRALHDALTGLPNRVLALDRLGQMLARARREHSTVAALYVDLDNFKSINDTFGHAAGDELLQAAARRLESALRSGDTAARLSGDEFIVLIERAQSDHGAPDRVAQRLLDALTRPYELAGVGRRLSVTASIGVATDPNAGAEQLLQSADLALYAAKAAGRNRWEQFDHSMKTASLDRLTLELDLHEALEREELFLLYQPTFELEDRAMTGVEALLRWRHPTRGLVSPEEFVPIAEHGGAILPIGRWVLTEACRQAAEWARRGTPIGVAVNVSARQLDDDQLVEDVREALEKSGLAPELLTLELTETALMHDAQESVVLLHALKRLGVAIAIDDFGTGYSSLAYLRELPADVMKIDRSFVAGVARSSECAALVRMLVQLGRSLGLATLAEGIEDEEQLRALQLSGCDRGQGFLFSRPRAPEAIDALLAARAERDLRELSRTSWPAARAARRELELAHR
jgi:diguanylate cyclase (GGDEF)-like protein